MSGLFGSFTFHQSDNDHSLPPEAEGVRPREIPTSEGQTEAGRKIVAEQTLAPLATGESDVRHSGKEEKSSYESEAEFYSPANGLPESAVVGDVARLVGRSIDSGQPSAHTRRSDDHSPTSASNRRISGFGLEGKQDSFITAEEIKLPIRSVTSTESPRTYPAYAEHFSIDPLSKDSDPSAEATPTSRSPRLKPQDKPRDVDANVDNVNVHHRIRSSQASQYPPFSAVASADIHSGAYHGTGPLESGSRTAGSSPSISPPQFRGAPSPLSAILTPRDVDQGIYSSPSVHHARRESPKETHVADVDVDPISGRKLINQYEIIDELGRGVHGKVKLGRNLNTDEFVAIKIVDRSPRRRRLGKSSNPAEKIKREIAILKKARHPNIVSLLEVIDDPAKRKVYIVLEHVEMGEIRWRTEGDRDICLYEYHRTERELKGAVLDDSFATLEAVQDRNMQNTLYGPHEQESESRLPCGHSSLSESSSDDPKISGFETEPDSQPKEHASLPQDTHSDGRHQQTTPALKGTVSQSDHANNRIKDDSLLRNATLNESHNSDMTTGVSPPETQYMHPSSRIFDTNATISAIDHYRSPVSTDQDVPEYFQYVPTMSLPAIREALRDTVLGLEYLHYQGVIHRDIKPANLLQTGEHRVKISDFGVSFLGRQLRENDNDDTTESEAQDFDEGVELAKTVGTPAFFAPELCQTDFDVEPPPVTGQIDVWALGVTLYCLVYGRVPYFHVDTFALMRMIAQDEVHIPRKRLKAIDEINVARQNISNNEPPSGRTQSISPEPIHEDVDDDLHDLIKRLLVKDSRKRITLAEVKRHPWILKDVGDPALWVDETDPSHQTQGKKIEVSKEDVADAVIPLNIIERVKNEFKRIGGALGLGRSSSRRKRADSSSVAIDQSPFKLDKGASARGTNRRPTEATVTSTYVGSSIAGKTGNLSSQGFSSNSRDATSREDVKRGDYFGATKAPPRPSIPEQAYDRRTSMPAVPNFQRPSIPSVRSPPLSDSVTHDGVASFPAQAESFNLSGLPAGNAGKSNIIGEPGRRFLRSVRSRERRSQSRLRQGDEHKRPTQDLQDQSEHQRAGPSVAFSTAHAEGHVDVLPAGRRESFAADSTQGSPSPRPLSFSLTEQISSASGNLSVSRKSSGSSPLSPQKSTEFANSGSPRQRNCFGQAIRRKKSGDRYQQAQEEVIRRMVIEDARFKEAHTTASRQRKQWNDTNYVACPPSPDDNSYGVDYDQTFDQPREQLASPNSYASRWHNQYITPSSSDDHFTSGVSQSTSNPSIPSVASASSSIIPEEDCKGEPKPAIMRRSSGDTVKTKPKVNKSRYSKTHAATGTRLVETDADYHEDADADNDNDNNDDPDEEDDDDDDFIELSRRKSTLQGTQIGNVYRSKSIAYQRPARRRFPRRSIDDGS